VTLTGWTVVLRAIRYRPGRSAIVFVLAAIATAATVVAPAYSRAAQQSVLSDGLREAPKNATSLQVRSDPIAREAPALESTSEAKVEIHRILSSRSGLAKHLDQPVGGADIETVVTPPAAAADPVLARLAYRDSACTQLVFSQGTCAREQGDVIVSDRSAHASGIAVGTKLALRARGSGATTIAHPLTVVGLYTPKDANDPYWGRGGYFAAGAPDSESSLARLDAIFVGDEGDLTLPGAQPSVFLDYQLKTKSIRLDDVAALRSDLSGFETDVDAAQVTLSTALRSVLDDIDTQAAALGRTVPVVTVPLIVVCWFVLLLLVAALTDERSPEVALAKLRGFSLRRAARFGRGEALMLIVLAVPAGAALGLGLVEIVARQSLSSGVHVELRWPVAVAAGVALAASYLAVRLGSAKTLARPVLSLLRRVPERTTWRAGAAEAGIVALAAASLVVAISDQGSPLALLAPALLAVVAGVVTARMLSLWSRVRVRRSARRGRVTGLLAHAQLSRRPLGHRVILVVTIAVAVLSFAATAWDVAAAARHNVAADTVGADRVLQVVAAHPAALVAAVDAADPGGHSMPVVRVSERYGDHGIELMGVGERFPDVAVWRGHDSSGIADVADRLRPELAAPLNVDRFVQVDVAITGGSGDAALGVVVAEGDTPTRTVSLGALTAGAHRYRVQLNGCANGCRLIGLAILRTGAATASAIVATLRVDAISTARGALPAGFDTAGRWRAATRASSVTVRAGNSLRIDVNSTAPGDLMIEHVDTPDALPVVLAGPTPADDADAVDFSFPGLGEAPQRFTVVDREAMVPRAGRRALLFDLDNAVRAAQRTSSLSDNSRLRYEVWSTAAAPPDLADRLSAAGVLILRESTLAAEQDRLARSAPALGLRLYLAAGCAALLLAVGVVLLTAMVGAQTRRYELAALRVAGVRAAVLRRGLLREYLHVLGLPLIIGGLTGVLVAMVIIPGIPLVTVGTPLGELTYSPSLGALPVALALVVAGLLVAVLAVLSLVRRASPDLLREGGVG
jgi:putative ABC transport system permease protein